METDTNIAAQIVAEVLEQEVQEVNPVIGKGLVNLIFFARSHAGMTVVRLSKPEDADRALAFYEKEAWCLNMAATLGIPGPQVLAVGNWAGRPYMLQSYVPGINGDDLPLHRPVTWRALGRYAKKIHSVRLSGFGETLESFHAGNAAAEWEMFINYNLASLTRDDELIKLGVYRPDQANQIRDWFSTLQARNFTFGLNHGDLSQRNTVIDESGQVSLLDWGSAEAHLVPHYDFRTMVGEKDPTPSDIRAFLEGYEMDEAEYRRLLPELRTFTLLKAFDLTRWAIDRCPEVIPDKAAWARAALQDMLSGES